MVEVVNFMSGMFYHNNKKKNWEKSTPDSFSMLKLVYSCDYYLNCEYKAKLSS